jgi:hypothetical protein
MAIILGMEMEILDLDGKVAIGAPCRRVTAHIVQRHLLQWATSDGTVHNYDDQVLQLAIGCLAIAVSWNVLYDINM